MMSTYRAITADMNERKRKVAERKKAENGLRVFTSEYIGERFSRFCFLLETLRGGLFDR